MKDSKPKKANTQNNESSSKANEPFFNKKDSNRDSIEKSSVFFQPKLSIGEPGDKYEQEADSMADAVVNNLADSTPGVQQKPIKEKVQRMVEEEEPIQRMTEEEEPIQRMVEEEEIPIQTKGNSGSQNVASDQISQKINQKKGSGKSLPETTKTEMESSFGSDFSKVNVHTDADAIQMNHELGAQAFTTGKDVFFNKGKYQPESSAGKHLLAHELTHVVQQGGGTPTQIQKKGEKEVLSDLENRAEGEKDVEYNYDADEDKSIAYELADSYFKDTYGEENFAENLVQTVEYNLFRIYGQIKDGQISAIEGIQGSIDAEREKMQMIFSALVSLVSIIGAWAPIAAASVASARTSLIASMGNSVRNSTVRLHSYARLIEKFGTSDLLSPWMTTMRAVKSVMKSEPKSATETIKTNVESMADKTSFVVHALVLKMGIELKGTPKEELEDLEIGILKSALKKEILYAIFPEYKEQIATGNYSKIQGLAKTQMLKHIVLNSAKVDKSQITESWDSIEGNYNKEGASTVKHALNAMGGEDEFVKELKSPYEFAFASLNSSLNNIGLEMVASNETLQKASESDYLNQNRKFAIKIKDDDLSVFREFLNDKEIVTNNFYSSLKGPLKTMKKDYPGESGSLYSSYTSYMFNYENVQISDIELWIHPSQYKSMLDGKVIDVKSFTLIFNSSGKAIIIKRKVNQYGRFFSRYGTYDVGGNNVISVSY